MSSVVTINLQAYHERLAPVSSYPPGYQPGPEPGLLEHQVRTFQALEQTPLVMNTYLTGTGKTRAALLRLLHPAQRGNNVVLIAPTNALLAQHVTMWPRLWPSNSSILWYGRPPPSIYANSCPRQWGGQARRCIG